VEIHAKKITIAAMIATTMSALFPLLLRRLLPAMSWVTPEFRIFSVTG
jgi:hypothetical protein